MYSSAPDVGQALQAVEMATVEFCVGKRCSLFYNKFLDVR